MMNASLSTSSARDGFSRSLGGGTGDPWILDTYDATTVTDGGHSASARYCFDPATGFLAGRRVLQGTSGVLLDASYE